MKNLPISVNEKFVIISELSTMLGAGIPITEALEALMQDAKGNSKKVLQNIYDDINQGKKISDSIGSMSNTFDQITINLINTAEESGNLETTLKDIAVGIKKDMELSEKVKSAMIYPLLVLTVFCAVFILILTFVIPKVASVFSKLRVILPLPTRILIVISNFFTQHTIPIIIGVVLFFSLCVYLYKTKKAFLVSLFSKLPVLNTLSNELDITRFSHTMSLLLKAGIPINKALELTQSVIGQKKIVSALAKCKEIVLAGKTLSSGLKDYKNIFPGVMIRIIEVGEKSGSLEQSMQDLSEYFDTKVSNSLKNLTVLIEPVLILIVGVFIGGMMLAIIAPIYQLIGQIRSR